MGSIPGLGRFPGVGNGCPLQYSCLRNSMDRRAWRVSVPGVAKSQTWLSDWTTTTATSCIKWKIKIDIWVFLWSLWFQFSSVTQSCPTLCNPMSCSTPGLPVHHQLPEFTETHVHRVSDAIQPSHPLSSPSPLAPNPSQHQSLFQWVNSLHEVAKVLEFQL